jgi:cell division protein FtsB
VARLAPITRVRRRSPLGGLWLLLVSAAFLGYFGFHAFNGDFGIWAMDRLQAEGARLGDDLAELKAEREALEKRVAALRPQSLDADVIDISARSQLNMLRADEVVLAAPALN